MKQILQCILIFIITTTCNALPIQVSVVTDKEIYNYGDIITIRYLFINRSDDPIIMFGGSTCFHFGFNDIITGESLQLVNPLPSDRVPAPYQSLIMLLSNESYENILQMKISETECNKFMISTGLDNYCILNGGVMLKGVYSKNIILNDEVYSRWRLPIYDGDDLESNILFRLVGNQIVVENVPASEEALRKETEQRKNKYYSENNFWGVPKSSYSLNTIGDSDSISTDEWIEHIGKSNQTNK